MVVIERMEMSENHLTVSGDLSLPVSVLRLAWEIYGCFSTRVSLYGGGAFLIPYIIFVVLIGATGVIGEMSLGRAARSGPIDAFGMICEKKGKRKLGEALGMIPVLGSLAMAIGYTVVMGSV